MKALKNYLTDNTIVAFHVSGGGGNRRQLECLGEHMIGDFIDDDLWAPVDEDGNEIEGEYMDNNGNPVGLTTAMVRSGLGIINLDGDYDTYYTKRLGDIKYTDEEAYAMANSWRNSDITEEDVVAYYCQDQSEEMCKVIIKKLGLNIDDYFESEDPGYYTDLEQLREYLEDNNYTEAIYISGGGNAFLEFPDDILESMEVDLNNGYTIREGEDMGLDPDYLFLYLSKEDREWAQDAHLLVADKYNSERGYYLLK